MRDLEQRGELKRITVEVDPYLELAEIADRVMREHGPALLFENVKGSAYPVLINAMGSNGRMALALGATSLDAKAKELADLIDWALTQAKGLNLAALVTGGIPKLGTVNSLFPRRTRNAPCQEVIEDDPRFSSLPVLTSWPQDGGPFFTLPLVCTRDPETGHHNMGMYRMQVYDDKTCGMHWHVHKDGAHFFQKYKKLGKRMPVAVALGCDPAVTYSATAPLPQGIWEMIFAGYLRGSPTTVARATLSNLLVPADAEFVLEGYVDPNETRLEGPFGDHTGYYSLTDQYPVFHLERITRRKNPVFPATIVGKPPKEDCYMAKATERLFLPLLQTLNPDILDINMPLEGVFHDCVIVRLRKRFPGHARVVMNFLWGLGQMMYTKMIIVVDSHVDAQDLHEVMWRVFNNIDAKRDLVLNDGPLDALDHSSPHFRFGTRLGVDATKKLPEEGHPREWPDEITMTPEIRAKVERRWKEYGF
jgi:4-hydroxy-3-polyprenylbenzoate decarboxylase